MKMSVFEPSTLKKCGLINKYSMLEYTQSYSDVGNFNLYCALVPEVSSLLKKGRIILFEDDIAGIIEYIERDATAKGVMYVKGPMIEGLLKYRVVYPQYEKTDYPENIMCELVKKYCATDERKFNLLEIEMPSGTWSKEKITYQKTGGSVADSLQTLSETYDIGYRISVVVSDDILTGHRTRKYIFKVYKGKNRTLGNGINKTALFGFGFNNILSSDYVYNAQQHRNFAIVAGEGEGNERKTVEVFNPIIIPHNFVVRNIIPNEGFEEDLEGYELSDLGIFDIIKEYSFRGKKCLRMYGNLGKEYSAGLAWARPQESKNIIPGHTYYCTVAVRFLKPVEAPTAAESEKLKNPIPIMKLGQETAYIDLQQGFTVGVIKIIRLGPYTVSESDVSEGLKVGFPLIDGLQINTELIVDTIVLTDLTEAFGDTEIPGAEWCKDNIPVDMVYGGESTVTTYSEEMPLDFDRKEIYVDARDIQSLEDPFIPEIPLEEIVDKEYFDMLRQRGYEKMAENYKVIESYKAEIRNDEKAAYIYGRDFELGDKVTVIDDDLSLRLDAVVTGVTVSAFEGGRTIEPTFGFELPTVYQQIKKGVI